MSKKHYLMMAAVIALSGFIFWREAKDVPLSSFEDLASVFSLPVLLLGFLAIIVSYLCEGTTLMVLENNAASKELDQKAFYRVPLIQSLFNAITPMSSGGQPSQLMALIQMGIEGGRATSILLMKFIIFQIVVLFYYLITIFSSFSLVASKFAGLSIFILIGFMMHIISITFLLLIMFKYQWTKKMTLKIFGFLERHFNPEKMTKAKNQTLEKIDNFYREGMHLKQQKKKLIIASVLTVVQMICFYSVPYFVLGAFGVHANYFEVLTLNIMITMIIAIVPIPGGTGGAEYSFKMLFASFITGQSVLILSMFVWRFITYYFGMFLGLIALAIKPRKPEKNN